MKYLNKKVFLILAIIVFSVVLFSLFYSPTPKLISSQPSNNANLNSPSSPIILVFNQEVNLKDFSFKLDPNEEFTPSTSSNPSNQIALNFSRLFPINKQYMLTITYKNKQLGKPLVFTTNAPKSTQYDGRYLQEIQGELDNQYPLMAETPYETSDYRIVYSSPRTLEITLKNKALSPSDVISEIKSWVTKNGGDSLSHKYVIAPASSNLTN